MCDQQEAFIDLYGDIPFEWKKHNEEFEWQPLLVDFANTQRDHSTSLAHLQLHSSSINDHVLFVTINHAGIDGVSTFHVFRSFFAKLGQLAQGIEPSLLATKPIVDIGARIPHFTEDAMAPFKVPVKYLPMLQPISGESPDNGHSLPYVAAEFAELSAAETANLISRCREHGATVQGAVSAAAAIAIAQAQLKKYPLPQTLLMQCPTNMRRQVEPPLNDYETSCAASFLWWPQELAPSDRLWDVAKDCTAHIRRTADQSGGLTFWAQMHASKTLPEMAAVGRPPYTPPYTITSSSIGINPIAPENGPIKIHMAHMMLSTFGITSEKEAGTMTHAHTFGDRLHITLTYSMPAVGHKRGRAMAATQLAVMQILASDSADITVADFME